MTKENPEAWPGEFDTKESCYVEQYEMFEYVTKELGEKAIVIDAEDLCNEPGKHTDLNYKRYRS